MRSFPHPGMQAFDKHYAARASKYASKPFWTTEAHRVIDALHDNTYGPHPTVIDYGCNEGQFVNWLNTQTNFKAVGLDVNAAAIHYGRRRYPEINLLVSNGRGNHELEGVRFDAVTMLNVLSHVDNPYSAISDVHRMLKRQGLLVMSLGNWSHYRLKDFGKNSGDPTSVHKFTTAAMERFLTGGSLWEVVSITTYGRRVWRFGPRSRMIVVARAL